MVGLDWKSNTIASDLSSKSPKFSSKLQIPIPPPKICLAELVPATDSACSAYECYLRLPELRRIWSASDFSEWMSEPVLRPAFAGLEITFRFISTVISDPRSYCNRREWRRRLEALAASEIEIIALLCEDDETDPKTKGTIPIVDLSSSGGSLRPENSSAEVWKLADDTVVVSHVSEGSLVPRLVEWDEFKDVARKIHYSIECHMGSCPYTLGLGEPNLAGKPSLNYDAICKPTEIHNLRKCPNEDVDSKNLENRTVYSTHQILESWICVAKQLIARISDEIDSRSYNRAASFCWTLEKVWAVARRIEDLLMLMDPDDFLLLRSQLMIGAVLADPSPFCFRSRGLVGVTRASKELKHRVPEVLGVEVDPTGGPRIQDAAMELYRRKEGAERIHLLQAMQAVETAVKGFYFGYAQVVGVVMGSLEAKGRVEAVDPLSQIYMEPTYFPSLDAAKTFLGERWAAVVE